MLDFYLADSHIDIFIWEPKPIHRSYTSITISIIGISIIYSISISIKYYMIIIYIYIIPLG